MPVQMTTMSANVVKGLMSQSMLGINSAMLAQAVSGAVVEMVSRPNFTMGVLTGMAGPVGSVTNSGPPAGLSPAKMAGIIMQQSAATGMTGLNLASLSFGISTGVVQTLLTMKVTGAAIGIGPGGGAGSFPASNPQSLSVSMIRWFMSLGMTGLWVPALCYAVSYGVAVSIASSTIPLISIGGVAPPPPTGPIAVSGIPVSTSMIA